MTDFFLLIPPVIAQIFNPIAELLISNRISANEAKAAIEIQPVKAK